MDCSYSVYMIVMHHDSLLVCRTLSSSEKHYDQFVQEELTSGMCVFFDRCLFLLFSHLFVIQYKAIIPFTFGMDNVVKCA